jgi:hypothetical protein
MNLPVPHDDGSFVSARVSRIAELVRDYDRHIDVRWIRPSDRDPGEPAFALVYSHDDGSEYVIFYIQDEDAFDEGVLARLYEIDAEKQGNILNKVDAMNEAVRKTQEATYREQMEEAKDLAYSILHSKKNRYKHNGVIYE